MAQQVGQHFQRARLQLDLGAGELERARAFIELGLAKTPQQVFNQFFAGRIFFLTHGLIRRFRFVSLPWVLPRPRPMKLRSGHCDDD